MGAALGWPPDGKGNYDGISLYDQRESSCRVLRFRDVYFVQKYNFH